MANWEVVLPAKGFLIPESLWCSPPPNPPLQTSALNYAPTAPFSQQNAWLLIWLCLLPGCILSWSFGSWFTLIPFYPFFFSLIFVGFCLWTGIQSFLFLHLPNTLRLWWRLPVFTLEGMAPLPVSRSEDSIFRLVLWLLILEMLSSLYLCFWQLGSCFCVEL